MLNLVNKLYIIIFLWAGYTVFEKYQAVEKEKTDTEQVIQGIEAKIKRNRREQRKIAKYVKNIKTKKQEIEQVAIQIEKVQRRLPSVIADSENITFIRGISDSLKIRKVNINPGNEEENGFYVTKGYRFEGEGTYLQFLLLVEKLAESERILNVKEIDLKRLPSKKKGRYEMIALKAVIESYRYNESHSEDRGIKGIEDSFKKKKKKRKPRKRRKRKAK
jgi:Tfp pilus assembly protein PilO